MEFVLELIIEIFIEVYMELMFLFVPEQKRNKRIYEIIAVILGLIGVIIAIGLVVYGIYLINDKGTMLGIIPIALAVVASVTQIGYGAYLYCKRK